STVLLAKRSVYLLVSIQRFLWLMPGKSVKTQGRIKELMDALPPDERQKALELLLAAKESH
ncbi:hypothetical protein KK474_28595, partial [Klebsiella pneumoniae]|nr:hypothetical protein [Klebsiella pneumoniae]